MTIKLPDGDVCLKVQPRERLPDKAHAALARLWKAFAYARELEIDRWEFSLPLTHLIDADVDVSDLRWLVLKGFVDHAIELTTSRDPARRFRPSVNLAFVRKSCFALSEAGALSVRGEQTDLPRSGPSISAEIVPLNIAVPHWDAERRVLRFGGEVVKQFRYRARNQEAVLAAFEEENWPFAIDDPLSPVADIPPKLRLYETIKSLNANQVSRLLRFRGDGSGEHVCCEAYLAAALAAKKHGRAA